MTSPEYPESDGLDAGERDLLALAATRTDVFRLCSCDKAALKAAHARGWLDQAVSLEVRAAEASPEGDCLTDDGTSDALAAVRGAPGWFSRG